MKKNNVNPRYCVPFANGHCSFGTTCSLRHNIFKCSCGLILSLRKQTIHLDSKRHSRTLATLNNRLKKDGRSALNTTNADETTLDGRDGYDAPTFESAEQPEPLMRCEHCRKNIENAKYDLHVEEHIRQQRRADLEAELEATAEDKNGVTVSGREGIDFGILDKESTFEVTISIRSVNSSVTLKHYNMLSSTRNDEHGVKFSAHLQGKSRVIPKGKTRHVRIIMHPSFPGYFEDTLELLFQTVDRASKFVITRKVGGTVGSKEDHDLLGAKAPYKRQKVVKFDPQGPIVASARPPVWTKTTWAQKLDMFYPPRDLIQAATRVIPKHALAAVRKLMPDRLDINTYSNWFQKCLFLEEERMKSDLDTYALYDVQLEADYPRYELEVKGLAENRPSVLVGDYILLSHAGPVETLNTRPWYEGRVHEVHAYDISLYFSDSFSMFRGTRFDVRFKLNRLTLRRMHQALTNKYDAPRLLFPSPEHIQGAVRVTPHQIAGIIPFNRTVGGDEEQMETVAAIVNQKPGSVPFVVFGPPGTGKTVTITEAIRQLLVKDPSVRILACAPSNTAADNIAMKLLDLGPSQIFRLNALSRPVEPMAKILRPISNVNGNSVFAMPDLEEVAKYRVIVSTCFSANVPAGLGLKKGHFSHIFIDEAGQGKEPELMIAIKNNASPTTNVILAGDNCQLGPIVHSRLAACFGLKISYLDRIMRRPIYNLGTGTGVTIVKLKKCFRSHPSISHFSNVQFYNSELISCGDPVITHSLLNCELLPKPGFPLIFHGIIGKDAQEGKSPSFFNIDEITQVKKYCLSLLENKKNGIKPEHIGVITPYHAQCCKIRDSFCYKHSKLRDIKVGSVEEFQGQERRVIIISTVRSNREYISSDIKRSLGFVANRQRLNVALTRAQALLIVVGNPMVLALDPMWKAFLNFVQTGGGWTGKKIDWDPEEPISSAVDYTLERRKMDEAQMEDTLLRLRAMIISKHEYDRYDSDSDSGDDEVASYERPILREAE